METVRIHFISVIVNRNLLLQCKSVYWSIESIIHFFQICCSVWQDWLTKYGYLPPPDPSTGQLQAWTAVTQAVKKMQKYAGLDDTGVLGMKSNVPPTLFKSQSYLTPSLFPSPSCHRWRDCSVDADTPLFTSGWWRWWWSNHPVIGITRWYGKSKDEKSNFYLDKKKYQLEVRLIILPVVLFFLLFLSCLP